MRARTRGVPDATGFTVDIRWACRENNYRTTGGPDDVPASHAGHGRYAEYEIASPLMGRVHAYLRRKPI
jgi:hypothetical protein